MRQDSARLLPELRFEPVVQRIRVAYDGRVLADTTAAMLVWEPRHVVVTLDGTVLADSVRPMLLLETHLPPRWYLPREDVATDLLEPSDHHTTCAYKGIASYLSVRGNERGRDLAWCYPDPLHDAQPVRDLVCFWSERSDLELDGVPLPRTASVFSGGRP
jgi:uncharacterized protein (DUF427 family)